MVKRHFTKLNDVKSNEIIVCMHELINLLFNSIIIHQFQKKGWLKGKRKLFKFSSFKGCIGWLNDVFFVFNNLFTICFKYPSSHNSPISLLFIHVFINPMTHVIFVWVDGLIAIHVSSILQEVFEICIVNNGESMMILGPKGKKMVFGLWSLCVCVCAHTMNHDDSF